MNELTFELAKQLIEQKEYAKARKVLETIADDPTAQEWLRRLQELEPELEPSGEKTIPPPVTLPSRLEVILKNYLAKDEIVLWYEQPEPNIFARYLNPNSVMVVVFICGFVLLALQFAILSRSSRLTNSSFYLQLATPLILFATPFIRMSIAKRRATIIHYVVTSRQGFIIENLKVKVLTVHDVTKMEIVQEKAGFTSLISRPSGWSSMFWIRLPEGFLGIAKANELNQLISKYWRFI